MALTSKIGPHDPAWPAMFEQQARRLRPIFAQSLVAMHHVGSTAVPDLMAKPEIDLLVVVESVEMADVWTVGLFELGYRRGGNLSPGHLFYKRDVEETRTHKIHVCRAGHMEIDRMLRFRDYLRSHPDVREEYQTLKLRLEAENTAGIREYVNAKTPFIEGVRIDRPFLPSPYLLQWTL